MADNNLGPIEVCCDSPPYTVVRACRQLGFQEPEDVRWSRVNRALPGQDGPWAFFRAQEHACRCGVKLPLLERCTFALRTGERMSFFLGQCPRCRTMFWEKD
jgi:hypothetical protein